MSKTGAFLHAVIVIAWDNAALIAMARNGGDTCECEIRQAAEPSTRHDENAVSLMSRNIVLAYTTLRQAATVTCT